MVEEARGEEEERKDLAPWEQHSAVISLPRFDYKAPSYLLYRSHSGFLITCTIKREKSATKEVISILEKFIGSVGSNERSESSDANAILKKRKIYNEDGNVSGERADNEEGSCNLETSGENCEGVCSSYAINVDVENGVNLSIVKLTRSGLLLFTSTRNESLDTVKILSTIFQSLSCRSLKPPVWCHRILPIQATCVLKAKELQITVSRLVRQYLDNEQNKLVRPIKFAVGYNRRGIDETMEMKNQKNTSHGSDDTLLDRNRCFSVVARAFHEVAVDSVVDLKSPEVAVLVEWLPISGVPNDSPVVAVSVLPSKLITTKPRLCVKALVSDTKTAKGVG